MLPGLKVSFFISVHPADLIFFFKTGPHLVAKASLELMILLPQYLTLQRYIKDPFFHAPLETWPCACVINTQQLSCSLSS